MLTRRKFLQVGSTLAATKWPEDRPALAGGQNLSRKDHSNFLVFMPDQHQGEVVLPHYPTIIPNLRRFASQGITFTQAFCPAPHCCPSRASFMTGLYPSEHGIFNNVNTDTAIHANPYPGVPFFSRTLREAGYELAYSGKWHVARDRFPQDYGWKNLNPSQKDYEAGTYVPGRLRRPGSWEKARAELNGTKSRDPGEVLRPGWGNTRLYSSFPPQGPHGYEGTKDHEAVRRGIEGLAGLAGSGKPCA